MIFSNSRYAGGTKGQMADRHATNYTTYVFRDFPGAQIKYFEYVVKQGDRLDHLAFRFLGDETSWWRIMDINPDVHDPMHIDAGSVLRIPVE